MSFSYNINIIIYVIIVFTGETAGRSVTSCAASVSLASSCRSDHYLFNFLLFTSSVFSPLINCATCGWWLAERVANARNHGITGTARRYSICRSDHVTRRARAAHRWSHYSRSGGSRAPHRRDARLVWMCILFCSCRGWYDYRLNYIVLKSNPNDRHE